MVVARRASGVAYTNLPGFEHLPRARQWVAEQLALLKPSSVHVCDGSPAYAGAYLTLDHMVGRRLRLAQFSD